MIAVPPSIRRQHPIIEVVDVGSCRTDLARRREVKFTFQHRDLGTLRRLLEVNGRRQVFNLPVSTVRSVYFDDARLSACRANLDGLGRRSKLRLRWYDRPVPDHDCYLEVKSFRLTGGCA